MMLDPALCPVNVVESLERYVRHCIPTGGFLQAVLENDLMEAVGRADNNNRLALPHICAYVYNEIPSDCHGSPAKVKAWLEREPQEAPGILEL